MVGQAPATIIDNSLQCPKPLCNSTWLRKIYSIHIMMFPFVMNTCAVKNMDFLFSCLTTGPDHVCKWRSQQGQCLEPSSIPSLHFTSEPFDPQVISLNLYLCWHIVPVPSMSFKSGKHKPDRRACPLQIMRPNSPVSATGGPSHPFGSGWYWPIRGYLGPRAPSKIKKQLRTGASAAVSPPLSIAYSIRKLWVSSWRDGFLLRELCGLHPRLWTIPVTHDLVIMSHTQ